MRKYLNITVNLGSDEPQQYPAQAVREKDSGRGSRLLRVQAEAVPKLIFIQFLYVCLSTIFIINK